MEHIYKNDPNKEEICYEKVASVLGFDPMERPVQKNYKYIKKSF